MKSSLSAHLPFQVLSGREAHGAVEEKHGSQPHRGECGSHRAAAHGLQPPACRPEGIRGTRSSRPWSAGQAAGLPLAGGGAGPSPTPDWLGLDGTAFFLCPAHFPSQVITNNLFVTRTPSLPQENPA